jgi:hypothetical protein
MMIDDRHVRRAGRTFPPFKANPVVDADAVLALSISLLPFQMAAGQRRQVFKHSGCRGKALNLLFVG